MKQFYKPVCFWSIKMLDQRLKFFLQNCLLKSALTDSAMTLTRLETHICIHSQRIQKRGTERAQGSVRKDQTVRQNFLLWLFLGFTKAMLTQGRSSMGGFHGISTIWEENLNCWVESQASKHSAVLPQAAAFVFPSVGTGKQLQPNILRVRIYNQNGPC